MKKSEINFMSKNRIGSKSDVPRITVRNSGNKVALAFYNTDLVNHCLQIGYIDDRVYFDITEKGYKPVKINGSFNAVRIVISGKNAQVLQRFVRYEWYALNYDDECELYYIEQE